VLATSRNGSVVGRDGAGGGVRILPSLVDDRERDNDNVHNRFSFRLNSKGGFATFEDVPGSVMGDATASRKGPKLWLRSGTLPFILETIAPGHEAMAAESTLVSKEVISIHDSRADANARLLDLFPVDLANDFILWMDPCKGGCAIPNFPRRINRVPELAILGEKLGVPAAARGDNEAH